MSRVPFVAGNWKMNMRASEAGAFCRNLVRALEGLPLAGPQGQAQAQRQGNGPAQGQPLGVEVGVFPPFVAVAAAREALAGSPVALGAQNMHWEVSGAFTGEVSAPMLADAGCRYVILGHSERRQYFGETDETVRRKVQAAFAAGLLPILCVGERLEERRAGRAEAVVRAQVEGGLSGLSAEQAGRLTIAYEPVWAIGTGENATGEEANRMIGSIRRWLGELFGESVAQQVRIQYGGSVKAANIAEFMEQPEIDGALVGGASLKVDEFAAIARAAAARLRA